MSGLLEKIFLGNVDENHEVDQEGYDDETKSGLTVATSRNKDVSETTARACVARVFRAWSGTAACGRLTMPLSVSCAARSVRRIVRLWRAPVSGRGSLAT
jgi:hypothetical protein